jgi:hypothetical protein
MIRFFRRLRARIRYRNFDAELRQAAQRAAVNEAASLAYVTLRSRAVKHGLATPPEATLARSPLVAQAASLPA